MHARCSLSSTDSHRRRAERSDCSKRQREGGGGGMGGIEASAPLTCTAGMTTEATAGNGREKGEGAGWGELRPQLL
eukprot:353100-Chlamydomonas_euryale.AAC.3